MKRFEDSAVSPVVGVMLMLVVTIIIAAVVSGFAGGLASDQAIAPQATISCTPVIEDIQDEDTSNYAVADNPDGFEADNGLLFEHKGGDGFSVDEIEIQVQSGTTKARISNAYTMNIENNCTSSAVTAYIMEIGSTDGFISAGDKFMLYTDNCYISEGSWEAKALYWLPEGVASGKGLILNEKAEYKIIDKASDSVISQGSFVTR